MLNPISFNNSNANADSRNARSRFTPGRVVWCGLYVFFCVFILGSVFISSYKYYCSAETPVYVSEAVSQVAEKMSNSYGISECKEFIDKTNRWDMRCHPEKDDKAELVFAVYPASIAPYVVPDVFYLVAMNDLAKIAAKKTPSEGLMAYLLINANS